MQSVHCDDQYQHVPVLCESTVELLVQRPDGIYVDGTIGGGGHAAAILARLSSQGRLIGIDKDEVAIIAARQHLGDAESRVQLLHGDFRTLPILLATLGITHVDGILLDLGVSSYQLNTPARGFSYMSDGPLDMRMDQALPTTACELVNQAPRHTLERILREYGEEPFARPLAHAIDRKRGMTPITRTGQLTEIIQTVTRYRPLYKTCARVFQAFRIAINDELGSLREALDSGVMCVRPGGRFGVLTYHSLEDRMVKHTFARWVKGCICPPDFPQCACGQRPIATLITKHPISPSEDEILNNPRARSAKLRMIEHLS